MVKVGDKIRILEDGAHGTNETAGSILVVIELSESTFYTNSTNGGLVWGFTLADIGEGFELVTEVIPEKQQYTYFESEMTATFDCDDTLVMWDIGNDQPYDLWAFTEQEKCKPEDVVRIEDPYKAGEAYYLVKHNRHIKLLHDYKARGFGIVVWSAGGAQWAKAVTDALGLNGVVDIVMAKPNRHVDDMPCTAWMGERVYIPKNKH